MKTKAILLCLACFFFSSAHAEWIKVDQSNKRTTFVDGDSIQADGDIVKVWMLIDFDEPQGLSVANKKFFSTRILNLINCRDGTSAISSMSQHSQLHAGGETINNHTFRSLDWNLIPPATITSSLAGVLCKRRK